MQGSLNGSSAMERLLICRACWKALLHLDIRPLMARTLCSMSLAAVTLLPSFLRRCFDVLPVRLLSRQLRCCCQLQSNYKT
jgi:hypothetical protein